ncbi:nuclear transport factor 2 family protein [Nocardia cyriacigeorgica]|uniref:Nuclear transport factor 2 family protein n=1 Tax=Nocardia cyriacigeorgica TaxID=135487 RepID=A0ABX0CGW9_9NOCA|nr:nuclear transport factor 2 family protein [Nocardia cyriacigeorgica]NEW55745.1 nuclear transport factor 2 family protein [Nocardia cyriacigeorgica]
MTKIRRILTVALLPLTLAATACSTGDSRAQLRDLTDRADLTALVDRLGSALDEGDFDQFRTIYTADATAKTPGGEAIGRDALIAQASRNHSPEERILHFISNIRIDITGDAAAVRANMLVGFATGDAPVPQAEYALGGVYRFDARRTPEGWRFTRVETAPTWAVGSRP